MFTGIVQELLTIRAITPGDPTVVSFSLPVWGKPAVGESILLHGICSTVIGVTDQAFTVEYMPETLQRTTVASWQVGDQIHAEPALTLQTKLSGNLVYGHVDCTGIVVDTALTIAFPRQYTAYVLEKGSVTVNGVNLTIVSVSPGQFQVKLIPQTIKTTTLSQLQPEQLVNLEWDYLTKVIVQTARQRGAAQ